MFLIDFHGSEGCPTKDLYPKKGISVTRDIMNATGGIKMWVIGKSMKLIHFTFLLSMTLLKIDKKGISVINDTIKATGGIKIWVTCKVAW